MVYLGGRTDINVPKDVVRYSSTNHGWILLALYSMIDEYELEQDAAYKNVLTPMEYANRQFNDIYKRNHKLYLASIEWDTWCEPENPKTIIEQARQREIDNHPFNKFF